MASMDRNNACEDLERMKGIGMNVKDVLWKIENMAIVVGKVIKERGAMSAVQMAE